MRHERLTELQRRLDADIAAGFNGADPNAPLVRKLAFVRADEIEDAEDEVFDDELVEGVLGRDCMAVLYGDSNSGKTFAAVDLCAAVARSTAWLDRPTAGGLVVYLATEAPASVQRRLRAYQRFHRVRVPGLIIVRSPINLFDGEADVSAILALISAIEAEQGDKVGLIVGDTLARISTGANENAGEDMGVVLRHADAIRAATSAAFLWVHHCGKDMARGMRGWSGMRAAIDTELEVTVDELTGVRSIEITKQRDLPGKGDRLGFTLQTVMLGRNRWGTPRGSCVVVPAQPAEKPVRAKRPSKIAGAIEEFLRARGTGCLRGAVARHFDGAYPRQSVYRELAKMVEDGSLIEAAGVVALPGHPGGATA